jgi:hypothetical protein
MKKWRRQFLWWALKEYRQTDRQTALLNGFDGKMWGLLNNVFNI